VALLAVEDARGRGVARPMPWVSRQQGGLCVPHESNSNSVCVTPTALFTDSGREKLSSILIAAVAQAGGGETESPARRPTS
jgi:hypothetical protein